MTQPCCAFGSCALACFALFACAGCWGNSGNELGQLHKMAVQLCNCFSCLLNCATARVAQDIKQPCRACHACRCGLVSLLGRRSHAITRKQLPTAHVFLNSFRCLVDPARQSTKKISEIAQAEGRLLINVVAFHMCLAAQPHPSPLPLGGGRGDRCASAIACVNLNMGKGEKRMGQTEASG